MFDVGRHGKCELVWRKEKCPWVVVRNSNGKYLTTIIKAVNIPESEAMPILDSSKVTLYNDVVLDRFELRDIKTQKTICRMESAIRN